ncbi:MAG: pyridoxal phosphate-dependent aminotransferase family protein [Mycobacteriaceae bacterium]|nr:pyridoxal phosphate-dependent aminotransferase family protein [Mycobacteriaceae bacterium]MBV9638700.1 pyridoxal phosphate-dependent aminotransferase family protein [Mycobacteriaceae bacterium]
MRSYISENRLPFFRTMESAAGPTAVLDGKQRIMLGSNNYLGLCADVRLIEAANSATGHYGPSCSSTPPFCGTFAIKAELEAALADWHGSEAALVYNSGYAANIGALTALLGVTDLALPDTEAHASIHAGVRLSGASARSFDHNDTASLQRALARTADRPGIKLIAVDGLYSMQGDVAPMRAIVDLAERYGAGILVDEAHSVGVFGASRTGIAEEFGCADRVEVRMGALSKGPACTGGYIAGTADLIDLLRLHSGAHLFSTTASPGAIAASIVSVEIMRSDEGAQRAAAALRNAARLRGGLSAHGLQVSPGVSRADGSVAVAPNVAVQIGAEAPAVAAWNRIFDHGVYCALAIAPAVRHDAAMLRASVCATHTDAQIDTAVEVISEALSTAATV